MQKRNFIVILILLDLSRKKLIKRKNEKSGVIWVWAVGTFYTPIKSVKKGAQWLSGRVLDSRPKGCGFEPHRRHCVVVLEQDTFILA